ncbi:hypothetical protein DENSPDRAFT_667156 [Dentipellis sp. KUC8613]|nr:hypothetical protein DENSPDRAFT_667156 [Dentipellis sp. KUC8613]
MCFPTSTFERGQCNDNIFGRCHDGKTAFCKLYASRRQRLIAWLPFAPGDTRCGTITPTSAVPAVPLFRSDHRVDREACTCLKRGVAQRTLGPSMYMSAHDAEVFSHGAAVPRRTLE